MSVAEEDIRTLLETHHAAGYGWALSCCGHDHQRAGDILHTAYLRILAGKARYDERAAFRTWLFGVIRLTAADEWRRHLLRALRFVPYEDAHAELNTTEPEPAEADLDERRKAFRAALARLPGRQREVLHLVFYEDMTLQQAAEVMGVSLGSARQHYERGKQKLRDWIQTGETR